MILHFGLEIDDQVFPPPREGEHYVGPQGLLQVLEMHLGLSGYPNDNEHLRIEQYRQLLGDYLVNHPEVFYRQSYIADQLATADRLLSMRDELLISGWDFTVAPSDPQRLQVLAELENGLAGTEQALDPGFAERFQEVLRQLPQRQFPCEQVILNEPTRLLPIHFRQLFNLLQRKGITIEERNDLTPRGNNDLQKFQAFLSREQVSAPQQLQADGSLLVLRAKRETDAAVFLAQILADNPEFRPLCLIPAKNRALDNALIQENQPALGILSASLARPSLQILKLAPAFLWRPLDPFKIMEFVSLPLKPLQDDLAEVIARLMAQSPGINSDNWRFNIARFFEELPTKAQRQPRIDPEAIREQYRFWFEPKQVYDSHKTVPHSEVIRIFDYIRQWAQDAFEESNGRNNSLQVLSQQARRIVELVDTLPESDRQLSPLQLERIVRTIYEPSPVAFPDTEIGHLHYVHSSSAVLDQHEDLIWWNFTRNEPEHFFSNWYQDELQYLATRDIHLQTPSDRNQLLLWQRPRAILNTQRRLLLVIPEKIDGSAVFTHPLYDEFEAAFSNPEQVTEHVEQADHPLLHQWLQIPKQVTLTNRQLGRPQAYIELPAKKSLQAREAESFSSLEALLYYPYQWVFRHQIKLRKSSILSIVPDVTLLGNLAHRFFELLLEEKGVEQWEKSQIEQWIDRQTAPLLAREGAVLLLYGREPERIAFINQIKYAAWSLISLIHNNRWSIHRTEMDLAGKFEGLTMRAKADLVLEREGELAVLDLKWRGAARRKHQIRNEEDLQLVTYAHLLTEDQTWAHTGYFILEKGQLIARNNLAFEEVIAVAPDADHLEVNQRIWGKMQKTYRWRLAQLAKGWIEIRTEQTVRELDEIYNEKLIELLEMKDKNAPFDDYRTLINLIE